MTLSDKAEAIYQAYPRKAARLDAIKAILMALRQVPYETLVERVKAFAKATEGADKQYIPYPASWIRAGRWDDDPEEWSRMGRKGPQQPRGEVFPARETVWSLTKRKEALEADMARLAYRSRHESPLGNVWENEADKQEYIRLKKQVAEINQQIAGIP
jgi:hypothetical protein